MSTCHRCSAELAPGMAFCGACGACGARQAGQAAAGIFHYVPHPHIEGRKKKAPKATHPQAGTMGPLARFNAALAVRITGAVGTMWCAYVFAAIMPLRVINLIMVVGVCRNGGDTVFAALIDVLTPWCVGVPLAAVGVLVLKWPIYLVMALVSMEEVVKAAFGIGRLCSGKWLHNLVRDIHGGVVLPAPSVEAAGEEARV